MKISLFDHEVVEGAQPVSRGIHWWLRVAYIFPFSGLEVRIHNQKPQFVPLIICVCFMHRYIKIIRIVKSRRYAFQFMGSLLGQQNPPNSRIFSPRGEVHVTAVDMEWLLWLTTDEDNCILLLFNEQPSRLFQVLQQNVTKPLLGLGISNVNTFYSIPAISNFIDDNRPGIREVQSPRSRLNDHSYQRENPLSK